ncbi:MAG: tetratricopeptide repeat protein [Sphingobacteriales bacterium]|nr:tetratricopeptide repeat protein [Sphingobacteriales bacterium]
MKKYIPIFIVLFILLNLTAFTQDAKQALETSRNFMLKGDHSNAVLVLNRALKTNPKNIELMKSLAYNYYMQKNYSKALETIKVALDKDDVDDQCFQIAGNIYIEMENVKDAEKNYKKGIKKFPDSGPLYNELGELLWTQHNFDAIKEWEEGIEMDPGYSMNYYNAARYYYMNADYIWSAIYGEFYINMDPLSANTPELKTILLESYKRIFTDEDLTKNYKSKNLFAEAFIKCMNKQSSIAAMGINTESITMIRTRFNLDWFNEYAAKFPIRLFDLQKQLLQNGMFNAYNQWIFGTAENLPAYENWINTHSDEYAEFSRFQKGRIFKIPKGQYYHQ